MQATKKDSPNRVLATLLFTACLTLTSCSPSGPSELLRGAQLIQNGQFAEALPRLERAVQLLPSHPQAWNHLGLARHGMGRWDAAADAYLHALELDRTLAVVHFNLGCLYRDQNRLADAVRELQVFTSLDPQSKVGWLELGYTLIASGQGDAASRCFERVLQAQTNSAPALNGLGIVQYQRGRGAQALKSFEAASQADPRYGPARLNTAITTQLHLKDRRLALQRYQDYLALPEPPEQRRAVQELTAALEAELAPPPRPTNAVAAVPRRDTRPPPRATPTNPPPARSTEPPRLPRTQPPAQTEPPSTPTPPTVAQPSPEPKPKPNERPPATPPSASTSPAPTVATTPPGPRPAGSRYAYLRPEVPKSGDRAQAARELNLGVEAQKASKLDEAADHYRRAVQADPGLFEAHYNAGITALERSQLREALSALEIALAIQPKATRARYAFGLALDRAGYPRDAAQEIEQAVSESPDNTSMHAALARIYAEKLRDYPAARRHYLKILELEPEHAQATAIRYWIEQHSGN